MSAQCLVDLTYKQTAKLYYYVDELFLVRDEETFIFKISWAPPKTQEGFNINSTLHSSEAIGFKTIKHILDLRGRFHWLYMDKRQTVLVNDEKVTE